MSPIFFINLFIFLNMNAYAQQAEDIDEKINEQLEQQLNGVLSDELNTESSKDRKSFFKALRRAYKAQEKEDDAQVYQKQKNVIDRHSGLCIECESLTKFTEQINEILTQLPDTNDYSETRISELMAHSAYTEFIDKKNSKTFCLEQFQTGLTQEYEDLNVDDALIIYQGEMDINRVNSLSLFGKERFKRSVFLRGKKQDTDKIIRVDLTPNEKPIVTLYQLQEDTSGIFVYQRDKVNATLPGPSLKKTDRSTSVAKPPIQPLKPSESSFEAFNMKYSSSDLKVTIFDFRDRSKITENFEIESDIEISSDEQEMIFGLARSGKASMAEMRIEKDGEIAMAFDMDLPTGVVQSQFLVSDKGAGAEFNLNHSKRSRSKFGYNSHKQTTIVEHSTDFGNRSKLAIIFNRTDGKESGFVEYKIVF
jgi:hypothetical protein